MKKEKGYYIGDPRVELLPDGRSMRLLGNYIFVDPHGVRWIAEAGSVVDGASIPQLLWSIEGGPWSGKYRNASIIHDVYCVSKSKPWRDVHWMFYEAMLASGVDEFEAEKKYIAVYQFGPRW